MWILRRWGELQFVATAAAQKSTVSSEASSYSTSQVSCPAGLWVRNGGRYTEGLWAGWSGATYFFPESEQ